ncbi:MAG: ArsR family transcriptional regulator [Chloroflexi bacterium]|nr:ArsR family transcriptional regulator [Chloroflexota bacterium]
MIYSARVAEVFLLNDAKLPMTSTREQVLQNLLNRQRCTINDLADAVEINPISVRHHIGKLETEGLVSSEEERHGVGRPRRIYFLTEKGVEQFPARNVRLTSQLITQLKHNLGADQVDKLFSDMAASLSKHHRVDARLKDLNLDQRLDLIETTLTEEGFTVQVERTDETITIRETSCPYFHVGQKHSEVCRMDQALISEVLATTPERTTCLLDGDNHCTYVIPMESIRAAAIIQ